MTVWLVAQPTRGLLLERGAARFAGTAIGSAVAFMLLDHLIGSPALLLVFMIFWVGACTACALLFRYFRSYALLLAGYTACIVIVAGLAEPAHSHAVALARIECTIIGILASALVTGIFAAPSVRRPLADDLETFTRDAHELACTEWRGAISDRQFEKLLTDAARIEDLSDRAGAGSMGWSRRARWSRHLLASAILLIAEARAARHLAEAEQAPGSTEPEYCDTAHRLRDGTSSYAAGPAAKGSDCSAGIFRALAAFRGEPTTGKRPSLLARLEWRHAFATAARPVSCLAVMGSIWIATGWMQGAPMVMSAAIFTTLFSGHDNPVAATRSVLHGSLVGAACALLFRELILPHTSSEYGLLLAVLPFLAAGAYAMARPRTAKAAIDYNMTFLLIAQPAYPISSTAPLLALEQAAAILLGVMAAVIAFRLPRAADPARRLRSIEDRLNTDLSHLMATASYSHAAQMRTRCVLRTLKIARLHAISGCAYPPSLLDTLGKAELAVRIIGRLQGAPPALLMSGSAASGADRAITTLSFSTLCGALSQPTQKGSLHA